MAFSSAAVLASDPQQSALLDAARAAFAQRGLRHTSPTDIALRAGVSRTTLYRRLGDMETIERTVMVRDVMRFLAKVYDEVSPLPAPAERLTRIFVLGLREFRDHPLLPAAAHTDPDAFSRLATSINHQTTGAIRDVLAGVLADSSLAVADAQVIIDITMRLTVTFIFTPSRLTPLDTDEQAHAFAQRHLVPVLDSLRS